ncbi:MAG: thiamine pyrophosphate-dependent dehydrogenase E1 component subunit alpha [Candidatus Tectomicrobia bacterium]|uniref:Thiamine pyrophosphate-dependent dehydrogenase E1 component subunit alpha n=1 Tax=Tectimicrobiota bacterium TaxID=2528274 RepID=A0A932I1X3_UNCTE|nr:thiamine pyrophosphate-dependent dehydrogenase E1 component subunit alpha [Candidatus Tectomicrobia bacterium]
MVPSKKVCLAILERMLAIRHFEGRVAELYGAGRLPGFVHLSLGGEAAAAAVCACLRVDDHIISTHRGHGHSIAKGADLKGMMAELFGKSTGLCKGKGGSMHIADARVGMLGANGIVGAGFPIAVGAGFSAQYRGTDQVTVCFFGDGASNHSTFHEGLNLASIWSLPVIFLCENNGWAISIRQSEHQRVENVADRASAYGVPGASVDGGDAIAVYEAMSEAVRRARRGKGPSLVECRIERWRGHFEGDPQAYRSKKENEVWRDKSRDPLERFKKTLLGRKLLTAAQFDQMEEEVRARIEEAVRFAEESPLPAAEAALEDLYAPRP